MAVRRSLIIVPAVLVTLLALLVVAPGFIDWSSYKAQGINQIKKMTGLDVNLNGDLSLAIVPSPRLYVGDVTVKAPAGSQPNLASIDRLDVNIALWPLLQGKVEVSSVSLIKPAIALEILKDGKGSWQTPEIEALMAPKDETAATAGGSKLAQAVSLQNISIKDGSFRFANAQTGQITDVSGINVDLGADTLQGPFRGQGRIALGGQDIDFKISTGRLEPGADSISVKAEGSLKQQGVKAEYAGVAGLQAPYEVQGETAVSLNSLSGTMKAYGMQAGGFKDDTASLAGLLTASADGVSFKNLALNLGGQQFTGAFSATMKPLAVATSFTAQDQVNLDAFMGQKGEKAGSSGPVDMANFVPPTLTLPVPFDASVELAIPNAIYNGKPYKDLTLAFVKKDKDFQGKVSAAGIPGSGSAEAGVALKYAARTVSEKTGAETYSEPSLSAFAKGKTQNVAETVEAVSGLKNLPYVSKIKTGVFDIKAAATASRLDLRDSTATLDGSTFGIAGAFMPKGQSGRPYLKVDVSADTLDVDQWAGKAGTAPAPGPQGTAGLEAALGALALPYDVDFDIGIQNAKFQGQAVKGFRAQGAFGYNTAKVSNLSVEDFAGTSAVMKGAVGDIKNLKGVTFDVAANSSNIKTLAQAFKVDTTAFPKDLSAAKITATGSGDTKALKVDAGVEALGGSASVKGMVKDPLAAAPTLDDITFHVKHSSTAAAIKIFAPQAPDYDSLDKPLDVTAQLKQAGKVYSLENLDAIVAGSKVEGSLSVDTGAAKPNVKATLAFGDLVISSLKGPAGGTAGAPPPGTATGNKPKWSTDPIDSAFLHAVNATIDVKARSLQYQAWNLQNPVLRLTLQDGALDVTQLQSGLFGGSIDATASLSSAAADKPLALKTSAKLQNVAVESLARALSGSAMVQGSGQVSLSADIVSAGLSQAALVSGLNGTAALNGRSLVLKGFDLAQLATALMDSSKPLDRLQQVVGASTSGGQTQFDTLDGAYTIKNGVVGIDSMTADGPAATVASTGSANLPTWYIDTVHTVTLKNAKEVAPFKVVIKGPLDNPTNTFGKGMFDSMLRDRLKDQLVEKLPGLLGDDTTKKLQQFGILQPAPSQPAPAPENVAPSGGEDTQAAPEQQAPAQQQQAPATPEEAFGSLLKGLMKQ